jgi:hypothetical protein
MRKVIIVLFSALIIGLVSCNKEDNGPTTINGPWELVKVESSFPPLVLERENITYTEKYQFNPDGSFSKVSTDVSTGTGIPFQALGKFNIIPNTSEDQLINLKLVFETGREIVGNCSSTNEERLFVNKVYQLVNNELAPCDGPVLFYERSATR